MVYNFDGHVNKRTQRQILNWTVGKYGKEDLIDNKIRIINTCKQFNQTFTNTHDIRSLRSCEQ